MAKYIKQDRNCKNCVRYEKCSSEAKGLFTEALDCSLYKPKKMVKIRYDRETEKWFSTQPPWQETTVVRCDVCGLFYKPSLGHKCKRKAGKEK